MTDAAGNGHTTTAADVLRGRGVRIHLATTTCDGELWQPVVNAGGEPETEPAWVRFSLDVLADAEGEFGSGDALLTALTTGSPAKAVLWCLCRMLHRDPADIGAAALDSDLAEYSIALQMAYLLAQGVDPLQVGESYKAARGVLAEQQAEVARQVAEMDLAGEIRKATAPPPAKSRGKSGGAPGRRPGVPSTSSGT